MSSPAQNAVRAKYGIGKGALYKRLTDAQSELFNLVWKAKQGELPENGREKMHCLIDQIANDAAIQAEYLACDPGRISPKQAAAEAQHG